MTDENSGGAATGDGSTKSENDGSTKDETQNKTPPARTVALDDHKQALDDMHRFKRERNDLQSKLDQQDAAQLAKDKNFEELSNKYKKERDESNTKLASWQDSWFSNERHKAVLSAAHKTGIRTEAIDDLGLLDLATIKVEKTDQGRVIIHGAEDYVTDLKKSKPHWFKADGVPNFNGAGGTQTQDTTDELTPTKFVELEMQLRRKGDTAGLKKLVARRK